MDWDFFWNLLASRPEITEIRNKYCLFRSYQKAAIRTCKIA